MSPHDPEPLTDEDTCDCWDSHDEPEPDDETPVMFCAVCDYEVPVDADECPRCGSHHFE